MQNTIAKLFLLLIVTGTLFTACNSENELDSTGSLEESVLGGEGLAPEDEDLLENDMEGVDEDEPYSTGPTTTPSTNSDGQTTSSGTSEVSTYNDGTYTADGTYQSPAGAEAVGITLVIKDDVVSSVSVKNKATDEASIYFQDLFAQGISALVVGKSLDSLGALGAVNGCSLTPIGFNNAVKTIKGLAS